MTATLLLAATTGCALGPGGRCGSDDEWFADAKRSLHHGRPPTSESSSAIANHQRPAKTEALASNQEPIVVRGQNPGYTSPASGYGTTPGYSNNNPPSGYQPPNYGNNGGNGSVQMDVLTPGSSGQTRQPMPVSGAPSTYGTYPSQTSANFQPPANGGAATPIYGNYQQGAPNNGTAAGAYGASAGAALQPYVAPGGNVLPPPYQPANPFAPPQISTTPIDPTADIDVVLQETQTGRFQFGVGVNSDAGVTGQITIDERNFDWQRVPTSGQDWLNGTAFRGAGQGFRIEAMPGNQLQRYMVSFTEPYLFGFSPVSLSLSAFFYNRQFFDWFEERLGGRIALGYRLSQDLSISAAVRAEAVEIANPRVIGVPDLDNVVGDTDFYSGRIQLTHDTRDIPFFPSEGQYMELAFEQAFGEFSYPRAELDYRRYFLLRERPDGSGRHTLAFSFKLGFSGTQTPIFENYFTGGYSTMRGFDFRGASPMENSVTIGGHMRLLGAVEYFFPVTADDMIKGVFFCDFGTTERNISIDWDNYRVSPGFGLRLNIPALGPAPLALDFAVPVAHAPTDNIQNFSFFFGFAR